MLEEFLEDITVAGAQLVPRRKAYRMDGTSPNPDMRKRARLGSCNCCDYFIFGSDKGVILIEETRLGDQIKDLMEKYEYLNSIDKQNHVIKIILQENRLKVYGSLLVLCRLFCQEAHRVRRTWTTFLRELTLCRLFRREADRASAFISSDTKYSFWLVASAREPADDVIVIDHVRDRLDVQLKGLLTKAVVDSVKVVPAEKLAERLASAHLAS